MIQLGLILRNPPAQVRLLPAGPRVPDAARGAFAALAAASMAAMSKVPAMSGDGAKSSAPAFEAIARECSPAASGRGRISAAATAKRNGWAVGYARAVELASPEPTCSLMNPTARRGMRSRCWRPRRLDCSREWS